MSNRSILKVRMPDGSVVGIPAIQGPQGPQGEPGESYGVGHGLKLVDGDLTVNSVSNLDGDNTLPASAALVQSVVGNIESILGTI